MVTCELPTFYGYQVPDTWMVDNWLFAMNRYFDHMGVSNEDWHYCVDLHHSRHSSPITWTKMKANFRTVWWSHLEQHVENLRKIIQDQTKASKKEINNFEASHIRDNSVKPSILSATIEVQHLQVPT